MSVIQDDSLWTSGPQHFWYQGQVSWKTVFPRTRERGGFGLIQAGYLYSALYFYYHYISSTSDHQASDPRGWGPLLQTSRPMPWLTANESDGENQGYASWSSCFQRKMFLSVSVSLIWYSLSYSSSYFSLIVLLKHFSPIQTQVPVTLI